VRSPRPAVMGDTGVGVGIMILPIEYEISVNSFVTTPRVLSFPILDYSDVTPQDPFNSLLAAFEKPRFSTQIDHIDYRVQNR
jgi:hypothetical protein